MRRWAGAVCLALLVGALAPGARAQIANPNDAPRLIAAAAAAGDPNALARLYAADALLFSPQGQLFSGRDAIRDAYARNYAAGANSITFIDIRLDGDEQRAVMLTVWDLRITPPGQPPITLRGRSMLYFRHVANGWMIVADMFQNLPVTPPSGPR